MTSWLLTWLWQGTLVFLVVETMLRWASGVNAATRYAIWWAALVALGWLGWSTSPVATPPAAISTAAPFLLDVQPLAPSAISMILIVWMSVALFKLLRVLAAVHGIYRIKDRGRRFPVAIARQLPLWRDRTGRRVRLILSDAVGSAAVLGFHDPCIVLPETFVTSLSTHDLDRVILHECAHVRRRDDWTRLLQALVESVLWIHPAVFAIGRELNLEREVACDDWVVERTSAPREYARCLSDIAEQRFWSDHRPLALALVDTRRALIRRVHRLLDRQRSTSPRLSLRTAFVAVAVLTAMGSHLRAFPLVREAVFPLVTAVESGFRSVDLAAFEPSARASEASHGGDSRVSPSSIRPIAGAVHSVASERAEPSQSSASAPVNDVIIPTPSIEGSRSFQGVHTALPPSVLEQQQQPSPWQAFGVAGEQTGTAAKKMSVGLATAVSRAGTSIARSF
jgi:bla regulator protein blaR1